jgi:hypothetical protein
MVMCGTKGHTTYFLYNDWKRLGLCLGKGGATWEHAQEVYLFALDNMGAPESLNDPIGTPTGSHDDRHKITHKESGAHPRIGHADPRDMTIDGHMGLFGHVRSTEGCDESFE